MEPTLKIQVGFSYFLKDVMTVASGVFKTSVVETKFILNAQVVANHIVKVAEILEVLISQPMQSNTLRKTENWTQECKLKLIPCIF